MKKYRPVLYSIAFMASLYAIIIAMLYIFQNHLIFLPAPTPIEKEYNFKQSFEEFYLDHPNDERINALLFKSPTPSKGLVLYFHGNSRNLHHWGKLANLFTDRSYDVFMIDYRGYGKSDGEASETNLFEDGILTYDWAASYTSSDSIILYGRSLGSAIATFVASEKPSRSLILESPVSSIHDVIIDRYPFLLFPTEPENNFSNLTMLNEVEVPVHIIHGSQDEVITLRSAQRLKEHFKYSDTFTIIEGAAHNDLENFDSFYDALDRILP